MALLRMARGASVASHGELALPRLQIRGLSASYSGAVGRPRGLASRQYSTAPSSQGLSYSEGPAQPPLLLDTVPEHFAKIVSQHGDSAAAMFRAAQPPSSQKATPETRILTYAELDRLSNTLAHALRSRGVSKGDRVAVSLGNMVENVVASYAMFKLGAVLVPLNPSFNQQQLVSALNHLGVKLLLIGAVTDLAYKPGQGRSNLELLQALVPDFKHRNSSGKLESEIIPSLEEVIVVQNQPDGYHRLAAGLEGLTPFDSLILGHDSATVRPDSPLSPAENINIQFTSGTTSNPKAAMLTHTGILNNGYLIASRMGLVPEDKIVCPPPLFHCFGCILGLMATATTGASILFPSPAFDPSASLEMVAEQRATGLYGVATMFLAEMELLSSNFTADLNQKAAAYDKSVGGRLGSSGSDTEPWNSKLKKGIAAGSSVPESLMRRIYSKLGLEDLVICYGMTETSPVSCMTAPDDPFEKRTGSVGRVMPHTAVKVVDPQGRGAVVPIGQKGELACKGYLVMDGYYGDEARTKIDLLVEQGKDGPERWMYTGDEAVMDEDGFVTITGRIKDLIIRGGENIHPLEIENCLFQHPLIQEVSVVGVPDEKYGEVVGAFVVPTKGTITINDGHDTDTANNNDSQSQRDAAMLTKESVRDWVKSKLSSHLAPKYIFWVDEFPKTASGKIQKYKLREVAADLIQK